ncbi:PEBP-like protein [Annulohypoxylon maeteangense]|uniref:PEBP-like protein n=1 Tax=Annulohypoxylon maeteangense TaxID=1927788 RepID=UPI0020078A7C|nr:PEBP-like protein [Annulohypoxylon maeteangense]KAI0889452.1 PEBP-like protein [Annulohypoxylon maeteangense]
MMFVFTLTFPFLFVTLVGATEYEQIVLSPSEPRPSDSDVYKVQYELEKAEIFPTVIDKFLPSFLLEAKWSSGERAELGNTVKVDKVQNEPTITVRRDDSGSSLGVMENSNVTYSIVITDPDAPSRDNPEWSEFCHFIATGIKISQSSAVVRASSLTDIISYRPPGPPPETGKHRYVFLLLAPVNGTTDPLNLSKPSDRRNWGTGKARHGVRDWAKENGLQPVAANFVYAQNEKQ